MRPLQQSGSKSSARQHNKLHADATQPTRSDNTEERVAARRLRVATDAANSRSDSQQLYHSLHAATDILAKVCQCSAVIYA